ncbi:RAM signaling network component [Entomortierella lignicola]|nr:RAM signaling network component [Entomortierella lignicola]
MVWVLSISKNRIEVIPTYIGEMNQLQFLKIEQNPIVFPPLDIVEFPGQDMEMERESQGNRVSNEDVRGNSGQDGSLILQQRGNRSASLDSLAIPSNHRQSKSEAGLRLSIPNTIERPGQHPSNLSPDAMSHKIMRTNGVHGEDQYRFISHSRGVSGDSTSSFGSNVSNDCDRYSEIYFQRLAAYPPLHHPLPGERIQLIEAARGILFALSQIYRAVKQVVGCSNDEKFTIMFTRLLQSANSAMTQLIQSLDRFDSSAQVQVPDQPICTEIMRCCESNVAAFRKLVHVVQSQIRNISMVADARLVRNLILMLHGALSEIRIAWESLLPLLQGAREVSLEVVDPNHHLIKEQQLHQHGHQTIVLNNLSQAQLQHQQNISSNVPGSHQSHPFQISPTISSLSSWHPTQTPHRSQNMSRTSNHSSQSTTNLLHDEDEDSQLLLTVEHAIEAARRLIQCLTETCMTRIESMQSSPQHIPLRRTRSVSASPGSSSNGSNSASANGKSPQDGNVVPMSPLQLAAETSSMAAVSTTYSNADHTNGTNDKSDAGLVRSPLFSPHSDTVPYSNGMCVSLPIDQPHSSLSETTTVSNTGDDVTSKHERRGTHSKGSSKTSFDPALPSIPQDEANEINSQVPTTSVSTSTAVTAASASASTITSNTTAPHHQYQPIMTSRSASVSGLPSNPYYMSSAGLSQVALASSSLPSQGYMSSGSIHPPYSQSGTSGVYSSTSTSFQSGSANMPPAPQLWREMKDCLLQMTEIVKRLDLDLTMIKTDDQSVHPHHQQHSYHYQPGQFQSHSQALHQSHIPHPHQHQQQQQQQYHGTGPYQQHTIIQSGSGPNSEETIILRRRFGMGVSDFVKSVVVISTLVRHLSTSSTSSTSSRVTTTTAAATNTITAVPSSSSPSSSASPPSFTNTLSTSPSASRMRSGSAVDSSSLGTSTVNANSTLNSSASATESSPTANAVIPSSSISALSPSPERSTQSQNQGHRQNQNQMKQPQQQSQQQLQQQQPEVFSRLVMTNVSNLTKITKELTMRMPRSSFRDYLLSSSSLPPSSSSAGGGIGVGIAGVNYGSSSGFGYGPVGSSILAMRKGSLI